MKNDPDQLDPQDVAAFADAFNEGDEPAAEEQGETAEQETGEAASEPVAVIVAAEVEPDGSDAAQARSETDKANADASTNKQPVPTTGEQEAAAQSQGAAADPYDLSDVPPEDLQRAKSWVGRMKKMEEQLKAKLAQPQEQEESSRGGSVGEALEDASQQAAEAGNAQMAAALAEASEAVESGDATPEEALQRMREDFGDEFVNGVEALAAKIAEKAAGKLVGEKSSKIDQRIAQLEQQLEQQAAREHFLAIHSRHPDFMTVKDEPEFDAFVKQNKLEQVRDAGNAQQINKMFDDYKARKQAQQTPAATPENDDAMAAAEGVRSGGIRIPDRPKRASEDDYLAAWDEA